MGGDVTLVANSDSGSDASSDAGPDAETDATTDSAGDAPSESGGLGDGSGDATLSDARSDAAADGSLQDATVGCTYDAGTPPPGPGSCGDGWRQYDPDAGRFEECDLGANDAAVPQLACSSSCQVLDMLAVEQLGSDGGLANSPRTLGAGRHPIAAADSTFAVAYLEPASSPLTLSLAAFTSKGLPLGAPTPFSAQSTIVSDSNPVVAALPCDSGYVAAWSDFGGDGDELGVAIRIIQPGIVPTAAPAFANTTTVGSQFDPDVLVTDSGQVVVAWVDQSDIEASTGPDLRYRIFDADLNPTTPSEQTLAATSDAEADIALAGFDGSWAAAWRDDANGLETIQVQAGATTWTVGPAFLPAPVTAKPTLASLDTTHLLVAYAVGLDRTDSGVANGSKLQLAVLDTAAPGLVSGFDVAATVPGETGLDQSQPALVELQGNPLLAWWTASALGDPNGEELWLKAVGWGTGGLDLSQAEIPLPRWPQARLGDQRSPALGPAARGASLVAGWDDLSRTIAPGEAAGDVAIDFAPTPVVRESGDGGP